MSGSYPSPSRRDLVILPSRRVLAVDAGAAATKLVVLDEMFGRVRVVHEEVVERAATPGGDEVCPIPRALADHPVALALPQHRSLSLVLDLPSSDPPDVRSAIAREARDLSGLGESQLVFDHCPLMPFGRTRHPVWVTLCHEAEIERQVSRAGLETMDLCEVTTSGNALAAAWLAAQPTLGGLVMLADVGALVTLLVLLFDGQPVASVTFPLGVQQWVESGPDQPAPVATDAPKSATPTGRQAWTRQWLGEVRRFVEEWRRDNPAVETVGPMPDCRLCGGGTGVSGLIEEINEGGPFRFEAWPLPGELGLRDPRCVVAYGAALHALGRASHPASLLPDEVRVYWNRHHSVRVIHSIIFGLMLLLAIVLGLSSWHKAALADRKETLLALGREALEELGELSATTERMTQQYEAIRPVLERQDQSRTALELLSLLGTVRSNRSLWYVLVGDVRSYQTALPPPGTNEPPIETREVPAPMPFTEGYVVEMCIPEKGEARRKLTTDVVSELRQSGLFANVDLLPEDRRRALVDPGVLLPEGYVALGLERPWLRRPVPGTPPAGDAASTNGLSVNGTPELPDPEGSPASEGSGR